LFIPNQTEHQHKDTEKKDPEKRRIQKKKKTGKRKAITMEKEEEGGKKGVHRRGWSDGFRRRKQKGKKGCKERKLHPRTTEKEITIGLPTQNIPHSERKKRQQKTHPTKCGVSNGMLEIRTEEITRGGGKNLRQPFLPPTRGETNLEEREVAMQVKDEKKQKNQHGKKIARRVQYSNSRRL